MYIYHALINALSAHMIHINLNMIFYTHVKHSPTKTIYRKYYLNNNNNNNNNNKNALQMHTHTHTHTHKDVIVLCVLSYICEYISLELFYFVNITSSCSLIPNISL